MDPSPYGHRRLPIINQRYPSQEIQRIPNPIRPNVPLQIVCQPFHGITQRSRPVQRHDKT